jgi:hypothetical protein
MLGENEAKTAKALLDALSRRKVPGRSGGGGVHRYVDIGPAGTRSLRVHCFWYELRITGLMLGMNPGNARSRLSRRAQPYEGPEYLVYAKDAETQIAEGRSRDVDEVVACAKAWLSGSALDELVAVTPFLDQERRALEAFGARVDPSLRSVVEKELSYRLTVDAGTRSVRISAIEGELQFSFKIGEAQIAFGLDLDERAVATWLIARVPVRELAAAHPDVQLERHAEHLEADPARWHWLHLRDRVADPDDVLAPMQELVEKLAAGEIATKFYSFSSLFYFCFSASSHYPFVTADLPVVFRREDGTYVVSGVPCDLLGAVERIEEMLAASKYQPFFGEGEFPPDNS